MTRYRTDEEIRRYDLLKSGVLLLLIILLALTWIATREASTVAEVSEATATPSGTDVTLPVPTLGATTLDAPTAPLPPGNVTLRGQAGPGAQIVILINGQPAGAAAAGVDGAWSADVTLPEGQYVVQAQTLDNVGAVVGESRPVEVTVSADASGGAALTVPSFDPLTGAYQFQGTTAPGATVILSSGDAVLGTTVADVAGAWSLAVPAASTPGEVQMQATDPTGAVIAQSEPLKLGAQPPSLEPPGQVVTDPNTGAATLPVAPGASTWAGQAEPGTAVELLVNGQSAGRAVVDATGRWVLPIDLPAGTYSLQLNLLDPSGNVLVASAPFAVVAGTGEGAEGAGPTPDATAAATTPPVAPAGTLAELLAGRPEFSTLFSVLQAVGVDGTLNEAGPFTLFAPTNEAFAALPAQVVDGLRANPQVLADVLQYHITRGLYTSADLLTVQPATLNGRLLTIVPAGDTLAVNDALITTSDIEASNGLIHAIDRILVPPLAAGVRPPVIDGSGVATFSGTVLTVVGTAESNRRLLVELNGEPFGEAAVDANGAWAVTGNVTPGEYTIMAYMLNSAGTLEAISRPVQLLVK